MTSPIRNVSFCPHCSNRAPQRLCIHTTLHGEGMGIRNRRESEPAPWSTFVAVCETCGHVLLYDNPGDQIEEKEFHSGVLEFPNHGLHHSVPSSIRAVYDEASRIRALAPNAFAVQIGRALEALCDDRSAEGETLDLQLRDLAKKHEIPIIFAELAHTLRLLRNKGAHSGNEGVHQLEAYQLDEFFRVLVEYVYVAPSKLAAFRKRIAT